jgi:hypothetical protein
LLLFKITIFLHQVLVGSQKSKGFLKFPTFNISGWLNLLVNHHQFGYIPQKLEKNKNKNKNLLIGNDK